jgi:hypothetical protein
MLGIEERVNSIYDQAKERSNQDINQNPDP